MPLKKNKARKKQVKKKAVKRKATKKAPAKKRATKKRAGRKAAGREVIKKAKENVVGIVTHYFPKVRAAVIKLKAPLSVGDTIKIKGHTTDFKQNIASLQINRVSVDSAKKGEEIGLLVDSRVRQHDVVCKV
ncbi:MAG: hypothetical protein AABY28_00030 [Candidatus Omnitrophota bacterium]